MTTTRLNAVDPSIDIKGTLTVQNTRTLPTDEQYFFGLVASSGPIGAADISAPALGYQTLTDAGAAFTDDDIGRFVTIAGSGAGNNGTFLIVSRTGTTITYTAAGGGGVENPFTGTDDVREPYTIADDINFERTDRKNIKGTAQHYTAVPTYVRPNATGTPRSANLTNLAGYTNDAKAIVRDVLEHNVVLRPPITYTDGTVATGDETFTTTMMHFVAGDLNSFITIVCAADGTADGTYRIKTVTDGQTVELDGLNATGAGGTAVWTLLGSQKGILSARNWADATDTTGIPIADTGAFDETNYAATYVEVIDPVDSDHPSTIAGLALFGRSFGDQLDPKATVTNEGTRFFVELFTGLNDGTASAASLEMLAGRSGSAATVTNATKTITGLTGMTTDDIGRFITLYNCGTAGNCGIFAIATIVSATSVTVTKTANFNTDTNAGSIRWAVSVEGSLWDFYNGDRYRFDLLDESAFRTTMIGGIVSDAALSAAIHNLQTFTGEYPGEVHPTLTNTGNYFVFSDLPSASTSNLEEIVQAINDQIGDRTYTGGVLGAFDGETITASLQRLNAAISSANVTRTIERLAADIPKFTNYAVPVTYVLDGTDNGLHLWVFWRGLLRDPGTVANGDDYDETDTTHITPYTKINSGDHINYFVVG